MQALPRSAEQPGAAQASTEQVGTFAAFVAGGGSDLVGPRAITVVLAGTAAAIAIGVYLRSATVRERRLSQGLTRSSAR